MRRRTLWSSISLVAGAIAATAVFASPAYARDDGVDMQKACDTQRHMPLIAKPLDVHNAYSWRCTAPLVADSIDVARACRDQYSPQAKAVPLDIHNAYSWRCRH